MTVARLYANENFPLPVVITLRTLGHDVLTTQDAGKSGQAVPDQDVLAFAISTGRAVLTINRRDFIYLHNRNAAHAGIVVCSQEKEFDAQAQRIHTALSAAGDLSGKLLRVNRLQQQ